VLRTWTGQQSALGDFGDDGFDSLLLLPVEDRTSGAEALLPELLALDTLRCSDDVAGTEAVNMPHIAKVARALRSRVQVCSVAVMARSVVLAVHLVDSACRRPAAPKRLFDAAFHAHPVAALPATLHLRHEPAVQPLSRTRVQPPFAAPHPCLSHCQCLSLHPQVLRGRMGAARLRQGSKRALLAHGAQTMRVGARPGRNAATRVAPTRKDCS